MIWLSVILPTYNESENIRRVLERIDRALDGMRYEAIVVDDGNDGTDRIVAEIAQSSPHIRLIHRDGRRGLATAVVEGIEAARGEVVCVLDADLQHPPETLPVMVDALERTGADLVVASRYIPGGRYDTFTAMRRLTSRVATTLARLALHRARLASDPLSGFFAFRRQAVEGIALRPLGYKILLEILARGRIARVAEVPYAFDARTAGQSKLTMRQNLEYLRHLSRLLTAHPDDLRFLRFALVGASGILVNTAVLWTLASRLGIYYVFAGAAAIATATTWNFLLNDAFTWRDRRSTSRSRVVTRYLQYWAVTGVGSGLHLLILYALTTLGVPYLISNLAGIGAAVAWNYRTNARWTWKSTEQPIRRVVYRPQEAPASGAGDDLTSAAVERRRGFVRYLKEGPLPRLQVLGRNGSAPVPRVSIIIPSADGTRSRHLSRLIQELDAQPFREFEVLIVHGDRRQGRAINTAAAVARGEIIVTMDDDTRLGDPGVLEKLVAAFETDPAIGIAGVANQIPTDAPPVVQRAMRELPRRSSPIVEVVTDSDMAEHPCLAIRRELFYRIGGEHEVIPRGLDPYLRREVRRLGYRVVVIPDAWIHHLLPMTLRGILRQYFRNGLGAAYVQKFYPEFVIEQAEQHDEGVRDRTALPSRGIRYLGRITGAFARGRWIYLGTLVTYAAGYAWGLLTLREESL